VNGPNKTKAPIAPTKGASNSHTKTQTQFSAKSTASEAQRDRILEALTLRPQTTIDLRKMGALQSASRIKELRELGHEISTTRVTLVDVDGFTHVGCALYSLVSQVQEQRI
jgi:hypothetical protein